jgi:hypothetical protein
MRLFPGRTLEELDGLDWVRLQRAVEAQNIEQTEQLRRSHRQNKYKPTQDELETFAAHDALYRRHYGREDAVPDPGPQRGEQGFTAATE